MPKVFKATVDETKFLKSQARFLGAIGGIGSGKTATGAVKAIDKIAHGENGIIVAPDFPQLTKATFPEFLKWAPMSRCTNAHLHHPHTQIKELHFNIHDKDVVVYYGGIENEKGWTGPSVNWVWFDEGGRKRDRVAFDILAGRIRIGENPQLWVTTSPHGISHWLFDVFVTGVFGKEAIEAIREAGFKGPIVEAFHLKTEDNKENLDPFYYHSLVGLYSGKLREQELEGAFVSMEGLVWEMFSEENVKTGADYVSGVPIEWWVDDGFTRGHPRVILMAQIIPPNLNVFDEHVSMYKLAEVAIQEALDKGWPSPDVAYVDSSAAELRSRLWNLDIDTVAATHDVTEGIKRTASWICDGRGDRHLRYHPRCTFSIGEIQSYVMGDKGKPLKTQDNAADATRYGVWYKDREEIIGEEEYGLDEELIEERVLVTAGPAVLKPEDTPKNNQALGLWYLTNWGNARRIRRN